MFKKMLSFGGKSTSNLKKETSSSEKPTTIQTSLKPSLPPNFADEVFNLELEAEQSELDIEIINRLLELYAVGIEYYESIKSDKYQIFKNKTRQLLLKQNVNNAMDRVTEQLKTEPNCNDSIELDLKKDKFEMNLEDNEKKQRQKELELSVKYIQQQDTVESVKTLMNTHSQDIRQNTKIIQHDTDKQKNLILQRLKQRKVKKQGQLDTEENESELIAIKKPVVASKPRNSLDLLNNDLGMDVVDITSLNVHTEPNLPRTNFQSNEEIADSDLSNYSQPSTGYNYELMIQNQIRNSNKNDSPIKETRVVQKVENQEKLNIVQQEGQDSQIQQQQQQIKKKKVKVSQKSVMEFQLQNSVIPF